MSDHDSYIVTFGEIMMRLATPGFLRFNQAPHLELTFGGGEANVAVSLANFGHRARFVTRLPDHDFGHAARNQLRAFGVDTDHIIWGGERLGIYFLETGASQRASKVIYDRAHSSISTIQPGMIDWARVFQDASWFHWTGITPAISDSAAAVTREALEAAQKSGLTISVDLNYRAKLWSPEKASRIMAELVPLCHVIIGNEEDAEKVFGIRAGHSTVEQGQLDIAAYTEVARQLTERFGARHVAITLRESHSATRNEWSALLYCGGQTHLSRKYDLHIIDRVGGGDSFAAGLIHALIQGQAPQDAIEFAVAASCLKHSIPGDFNRVSVKEVETLIQSGGSGRVQR